jgi:cytochrome c551/c552
MERQKLTPKELTPRDSADLLGYFYSVRFFDRPADAGRGKRLFQEKRCAECHASLEATAAAKPIAQWESVGNPIELVSAMWNHASNMRQSFASRKIPWPNVTGQDISDIALYARSLPSSRGKGTTFKTTGEGGEALFSSKGCAGCHVGKLSLNRRVQGMTLNDVAAAMWSHAGKMDNKLPALESSEMSSLVTWLWSQQVLANSGSAARGKSAFSAKGCAGCHDGAAGAPSLAASKGEFSTVSMISSLWHHGPRMQERMKQKGVTWPRFSASEMSDVIAYLNSGQ